jgi:hypothetical protein
MEERRCPIGFLFQVGDRVRVDFGVRFNTKKPLGAVLSNRIAHPRPQPGEVTITDFPTVVYGLTHNHGFGPGKFVDRSRVIIRYDDGTETQVSTEYLDFADSELRKARFAPYSGQGFLIPQPDKLQDIELTEFYEGDLVVHRPLFMHPHGSTETLVVVSVDYELFMHGNCHLPMSKAYYLGPDIYSKARIGCRNIEVELAARGDIWHYLEYGDIPENITSIEDRADFLNLIGKTETLLNIRHTDGLWRLEDALRMIEDGTAHTLTSFRPLTSLSSLVFLKRFKEPYWPLR